MPIAAQILAVEDDFLLASQLQIHLQQSGHCVTLSDGNNGMRLAERGNFDLILLAVLGPDGLGLLEQLRRRSHVPVLLMSALGDEQHRIAGFSQGAEMKSPAVSRWRLRYISRPSTMKATPTRARTIRL